MYKSSLLALLLTLTSTSVLHASNDGANVFEKKCATCHLKQRPSVDQMDLMVAPPMMGVMFHVTEKHTTKKEAVGFITDYIFNPSKAKALCMSHSIEKFGLMPSQKNNLTDKEAQMVAEYLFDNFQ